MRTPLLFNVISLSLLSLFIGHAASAQSFELIDVPTMSSESAASRSANFVDVNGDGWDDIFFSNGLSQGQDNELYINQGDGSFLASETDLSSDDSRSDGATFADVDNDGDLDAFVVTYGFGSSGNLNYFYRNNGSGAFTYEADIDMGDELTFSEMAHWIDVNDDQFLDLYVTNSNGSQTNLYYENQGDGSFLQRTDLSITDEFERSRSVDWVDYDGDGDFDLFITNEEDTENSLFRNDGADNFIAVTDLSIVSDQHNTAGSSWADVDNDGDMDLFVGNWDAQNNQLFLNEDGVFVEQLDSEIAADQTSSFGSAFGDIDNDGDLDLFVCNSYLASQSTNYVFINDGAGNFSLDTESALALHSGYTFGCAFGDYDNDGWLDIILANTQSENQANSLYRNTGSGNHWLQIKCEGTTSNHSAVGTTLRVLAMIDGEEVWQTRQIRAAEGYCSQNSYTQHFGLGSTAEIIEVEIQWPAGSVETFSDLSIDQGYVIVEGTGIVDGIDEEELAVDISLHPNPAEDVINIRFSKPLTGQLLITLIDLKGDIVFSKQIQSIREYSIPVQNLAAGEYIIRFDNGIQQSSKTIILK